MVFLFFSYLILHFFIYYHLTFHQIRDELREYRDDLLSRPSLILANKMDEPQSATHLVDFESNVLSYFSALESEREKERAREREKKHGVEREREREDLPFIFPVSTLTGEGVEGVVFQLRKMMEAPKDLT